MVAKDLFVILVLMILTFWLGYVSASQKEKDSDMDFSKAKPETSKLAVDLLKFEEGYSSTPYIGSEGYLHIGHGQKLSNEKGLNPDDWKVRTTPKHAEFILTNLVNSLIYKLENSPNKFAFLGLNAERQAVVVSMAYQMGFTGVFKFRQTWTSIYLGDYKAAAYAMLQSKWAEQTPARAKRHAETMRTGILP